MSKPVTNIFEEEAAKSGDDLDTSIWALPKRYADVNSKRPREYWDYENYRVDWSLPHNYEVVKRVGRGKYSDVFEGIDITKKEKCIIKVLKPVKQKKISKEVKVLRNLQGGTNIIKLLDVVRDPDTRTRSLIFEHINNADFKVFYSTLTDLEVRYYIYQVLRALDFCHSQGIMHRDVKPHNVMIDHLKGELRLIDWGLAEFYHPQCRYNVRVASRFYKGPELLVNLQAYHYTLDIWSLGCMMASMIFKKEPFFYEHDSCHQLITIANVLGTDDLYTYLNKYRLKLDHVLEKFFRRSQRRPWSSFITPSNEHLCSHEALDLIDKMLIYDHNERLLPIEAMNHPYFSPIMIDGEARLISTTSPAGIPPLNNDLLLYPLDFQNTWQASENAQINIHQEIPKYGPQDAWNYYKRFSDDYARIHQRQINKQMLLADYKNEQDQQKANLYHYLDRLYIRNRLNS